jgi:methyl-accepting chemotaxis protein
MAGLREAIAEIAAAASSATTTAHQASEGSRESAGTVARLAATMVEIDQIAGSISTIADQTNLLALNATIEAARAGETAKATERIRRVVDAVRGDVEAAGTSLSRVQQVISGASHEASRMAADRQRIVDGV